MLAAFGAQVATLIPFTFGLATASIIAVAGARRGGRGQLRGGLVEITPGWFLLPVCVIAVIGGLSTGTTAALRHRARLLVGLPGLLAASSRPS